MQTESIGDDCLELFDANTYGIGQKRNLGLCYLPPTQEELEKEARNTNLKLIPNNKEKFFEIILKEQKVRLEKGVQDLYVKMNQSGMVEEQIHAIKNTSLPLQDIVMPILFQYHLKFQQ